MSMPSREFFVRQAVLNAAVTCHGDLMKKLNISATEVLRTVEAHLKAGLATHFPRAVREEFNKLLSQYQEAA